MVSTKAQKVPYICGPLTELAPEEQERAKDLYTKIADLCEEILGIRGFVPHEHYDPIKHAHYTPRDVDEAERLQVCEKTGLLIVLAIAPSWGGGIEVEMAYRSNVPVILLCERKKLEQRKISRLLQGNPAIVANISYDTKKEMFESLRSELQFVRKIMSFKRLQKLSAEIGQDEDNKFTQLSFAVAISTIDCPKPEPPIPHSRCVKNEDILTDEVINRCITKKGSTATKEGLAAENETRPFFFRGDTIGNNEVLTCGWENCKKDFGWKQGSESPEFCPYCGRRLKDRKPYEPRIKFTPGDSPPKKMRLPAKDPFRKDKPKIPRTKLPY